MAAVRPCKTVQGLESCACAASAPPRPRARNRSNVRTRTLHARDACTHTLTPRSEYWLRRLGGEISGFNGLVTTRYKLLGSRAAREAFERARDTGSAITDLGKLDASYKTPEALRRPNCASFELRKIAQWLKLLRSQAPFLRGHTATAEVLQGKRRRKGRGGKRTADEDQADAAQRQAFVDWLASSPSAARAAELGPRRYGTCAVVGSGHDLRCGTPRGSEIDGRHEAIFRSNSAQHAPNERGFEGTPFMGSLRQHYTIDPPRGGTRTTFRVSCLFGGRAALPSTPAASTKTFAASDTEHETCIVPRMWFKQAWGKESANNARHTCCTAKSNLRSSYNLSQLVELESRGARFAFFHGVDSGEPAIDAMLAGSGGNALHAALALCERVNVYGVGLFSSGVEGDKIYAHACASASNQTRTLRKRFISGSHATRSSLAEQTTSAWACASNPGAVSTSLETSRGSQVSSAGDGIGSGPRFFCTFCMH